MEYEIKIGKRRPHNKDRVECVVIYDLKPPLIIVHSGTVFPIITNYNPEIEEKLSHEFLHIILQDMEGQSVAMRLDMLAYTMEQVYLYKPRLGLNLEFLGKETEEGLKDG